MLHEDLQASIDQREVGSDTGDFLSALRAALRQDPDVILIGEMRDTETVRAARRGRDRAPRAVDAAHAGGTTETVNRVIDFSPPYQQQQVRLTLAGSLRGIVPRLVPTIERRTDAALEYHRQHGEGGGAHRRPGPDDTRSRT